MKKSTLALAVAAVLAAPATLQADTILYGSARVSVDYIDDSGNDLGDLIDSNGYWDVYDNSSRFGVLGSEDLGSGLSAIYQYEFGVDMTEGSNFVSNRPKFVGLRGGFGQISIGTQETPYYRIVGITDTFNSGRSFGPSAWLGGGFVNNEGYLSNVRGPGDLVRAANSLFYSTPDFSGFSGEAMLILNGDSNDAEGLSDNVDIWNLAVKYSNGPFFAGVTYIKFNGNSNVSLVDNATADFDLDQWALGLGYNSGPISVNAIYEQGEVNFPSLLRTIKTNGIPVLTGDEAKNWYLVGGYSFGNNTLRAAYGQYDTGIDGLDTIENYLVGYQYNFSKRTSIWVEYLGRTGDNFIFTDQNVVSIGTRVDF